MTDLKETIELMTSADYKERFRAEYYQVKIRYDKLKAMIEKWDNGTLDFIPSCPRQLLVDQLNHMQKYLDVLEARAKIEEVSL